VIVVTALKRVALRSAYRVLRLYWFLVRPKHAGVKCVVTRGDEVLLVMHTYGPAHWDFPGGGIKRGEEPRDAARRELREELGVDTGGWRLLQERSEVIEHKRDTLHLFTATSDAGDVRPDHVEIAEVRWFKRTELPEPTTPWVGDAVEALCAEIRKRRVP
jgi:ADP-ribose pyrophosphatase YjhB (NUDIX family)